MRRKEDNSSVEKASKFKNWSFLSDFSQSFIKIKFKYLSQLSNKKSGLTASFMIIIFLILKILETIHLIALNF